MTTLSSLSPKTKFPLIPPGGLRDPFEYRIIITAAGHGVIAGGCHGVGGPGRTLRAVALAQPPNRDCELDPSAGTFGQWRRVVVVVVRAVAMVGVGAGVVVVLVVN